MFLIIQADHEDIISKWMFTDNIFLYLCLDLSPCLSLFDLE